jgi:Zn-dependent protease
MSSVTAEVGRASVDIPLTKDAREILERGTAISAGRGALQIAAVDVLRAILQTPGTLADRAIRELGQDPKAISDQLPTEDSAGSSLSLRQLLVNANREAQVLGHYQVDSIHLLLVMLYSDSPATNIPLQKAGLTLYEVRHYVQSGTTAAVPADSSVTRPDQALRRKPWPSLRGVLTLSPVFLGIVSATAVAGALLWTDLLPGLVGPLTIAFVTLGWITSLCLHEFGHSVVAYVGGDRAVAGSGYLSLNPLRYANMLMSIILPIVFLLLGGIALPGGAVYINHSALRTRIWDSAVSAAGPLANFICVALIAVPFWLPGHESWITSTNVNFFAALAYLGFFQALAVVLNLLPVPGLDGFGIIRPWLPYSMQAAASRYGMMAIYGVFIVLWVFAPARDAFYQTVFRLTQVAHIDGALIFLGQLHMQLHSLQ